MPSLSLSSATRLTRFGVALAALPTATTVGTAIALGRGKRAGFDAALPRFVDWWLTTAGVRVVVVSGREHLDAPRPAVFIFNHKNNWDSIVTASLVRTHFTGVAKKELEKDPLMGTFGRLMDLCFVDRSGQLSAAEQLKPVQALAAKGLSVVVSPEGTRSPTGELGQFKKGAFRIAMATGLPVIPIVIRNSEVLGDQHSKLMGSGRVETAVLAPIKVDDWKVDELDGLVAGVREQYVDALEDWPPGRS